MSVVVCQRASLEIELVAMKLTPDCCMQITIDMFVRGWTNCGVDQFECLSLLSTCTCVHTRLNKIHGFGQIINLSCAFSLYST